MRKMYGVFQRKNTVLSTRDTWDTFLELDVFCLEICEQISHKVRILFILSPATLLPAIKNFYGVG